MIHRTEILVLFCVGVASALMTQLAGAATVTFDDFSGGQPSFTYDADEDGVVDATWTAINGQNLDPVGPGPNQLYIQEPGLEGLVDGTDAEIRVDFSFGAVNSIGYSFALQYGCNGIGSVDAGLVGSISVYDSADTLLSTATAEATCTDTSGLGDVGPGYSTFVEAEVSTAFNGTASYALIDFPQSVWDATATNFIIDNFEGTYGSVERTPPVPTLPPAAFWILGGLAGLLGLRRLRKAA